MSAGADSTGPASDAHVPFAIASADEHAEGQLPFDAYDASPTGSHSIWTPRMNWSDAKDLYDTDEAQVSRERARAERACLR